MNIFRPVFIPIGIKIMAKVSSKPVLSVRKEFQPYFIVTDIAMRSWDTVYVSPQYQCIGRLMSQSLRVLVEKSKDMMM